MYFPRSAPSVQTVDQLQTWLDDELSSISGAFAETTELELRTRNAEPTKPRDGMIVAADGTNWNPGQGQGLYAYFSGWIDLISAKSGLRNTTNPLGYMTGAGGSITQSTNKGTAVTLNTATGQITTSNAALAANTTVAFTLNNSQIAANDTIVIHRISGGTDLSYRVWIDKVGAGTASIALRNETGGSLSEAVVLQFSILKGVAA